jgi:ubiquinone/menaquinone biosynthesis C-methylase UbiE
VEATSINHETDELRAGLHTMWNSVAPAWDEHAEFVDGRSVGLTDRLIELAAPGDGDHVIELACGAGGLGLEVARRVRRSEVVVSDVAPAMVEIAHRRASDAGLGNVTALVRDLEAIDEPDASFDVAICREGLMLVPDPDRAAAEILRTLRPGGRLAAAVWGPRGRNPWLGVLLDAVSAELGVPVPPPGLPTPFSLSGEGQLAEVLTGAGFAEVSVQEIDVPYSGPSFEDWWDRTTSLAGPIRGVLASMDAEKVAAIQGRAREALSEFETADGLEIPGVSLAAAARRPSD